LTSKILTSGSRSLALGAFALVTASFASAQIVPGIYRSGDILVEAPWSRASPGGAKVASGYMRITNVGPLPDRLIGGSAAVAGGFEVHLSTVVDGIARMEPVTDGLEIKPGETVELRPGGAHGMLVDLQRPLKDGELVKGTLVFEKAGPLEIEYRVAGIGAKAPPAAGGSPRR
jgi:periplasmic copper chaperone A